MASSCGVTEKELPMDKGVNNYTLKLFCLTLSAIFVGEALVMLLVEAWGAHLSIFSRVLLDSTLLLLVVLPTLYLLVFKELIEQIQLRRKGELAQEDWGRNLEVLVEERTERLRRANEDLLVEVQERARVSMALNKALSEARAGRKQLQSIFNGIQDALVVVDDQWRVLMANTTCESLLSYSAYDLQGRDLKEFLVKSSEPSPDQTLFWNRRKDDAVFRLQSRRDASEFSTVKLQKGDAFEWEGNSAIMLILQPEDKVAQVNCSG